MARPKKDHDGEESKAVQLTTKLLKDFGKNYDSAKQKVSDAAMGVASIMRGFQEVGGNNQAFKLARKLAAMEELKAQDFLRSFHMYLTEFGVYEQLDMLDETPDIRKGSAKTPTHSAASAAAH